MSDEQLRTLAVALATQVNATENATGEVADVYRTSTGATPDQPPTEVVPTPDLRVIGYRSFATNLVPGYPGPGSILGYAAFVSDPPASVTATVASGVASVLPGARQLRARELSRPAIPIHAECP